MIPMFGRIPETWEVRADYAYEDRYGGDTNSEKAEAFDCWLFQVRAEAWDEGHSAGQRHEAMAARYPGHERQTNPYRSTKENQA